MRCDDVLMNLPDYILDKIEPNLKRCIESHLRSCSKCVAEYNEMKEPIKLLGQAGVEEYPDAFWQELRASIMDSISVPKKSTWRVPAFAAGLATLVIAIGIGIYISGLKPDHQTMSVATLATSLPSDQAVVLPQLNVNYVNAVSSQASELDEMDAVDDSVQQAVVKSLWASVTDSTASLEDYLYSGSTQPN